TLFAKHQLLNRCRARVGSDVANAFAEQGVDEAALAGFYLSDHNEQGRGLQGASPGAEQGEVFLSPTASMMAMTLSKMSRSPACCASNRSLRIAGLFIVRPGLPSWSSFL